MYIDRLSSIKHNSNGSSGADIFLLENTTAEGSANTMAEAKRALQALGYSREQVNKLMFMIRWLKAEGYLDALILYVRFYNRGTLPSEKNMEEFAQQFNDIVALTINGRIMSPYSDIINQITDFQGHVVAVKGSAKVAGAPVVNAGVMSFSGNGMKVA